MQNGNRDFREKMFSYKHRVHHDAIADSYDKIWVLFTLSMMRRHLPLSFQIVSMEFKVEVMILIRIIYSLMEWEHLV